MFFGTPQHNNADQFVVPIEALAAFFFVILMLAFVGPGQELDRALGRVPTHAELTRWADDLRQFGAEGNATEADILASRDAWTQIAHALFNIKEFIYCR